MIKTVLKVVLVAAIGGTTGILLATSPSSARGADPSGSVSCNYEAQVDYTPSLVPRPGVPGTAGEIESLVDQTVSGCSVSTTPALRAASGRLPNQRMRAEGTKDGTEKFSGGCALLEEFSPLEVKIHWGSIETTTALLHLAFENFNLPNVDAEYVGTVTGGSFLGETVHLTMFYDRSSSTALVNCLASSPSSTPITQSQLDPALSNLAIG